MRVASRPEESSLLESVVALLAVYYRKTRELFVENRKFLHRLVTASNLLSVFSTKNAAIFLIQKSQL